MVTRKEFSIVGGFFRFWMNVLQRGKAYNPSNENNFDVILVMIYQNSFQILPYEIFLEEYESLLISGNELCLLWNIGNALVEFVAIHMCGMMRRLSSCSMETQMICHTIMLEVEWWGIIEWSSDLLGSNQWIWQHCSSHGVSSLES